jgi:hypothetical protein
MCPFCASTLAWLAFGGASAGGLSVLLLGQRRKGNDNDDDDTRPSDRDT